VTVLAESPRPNAGFRHEAVQYHGDRGFVDYATRFVEDGLATGEPVLVAVPPDKVELLRDALGADADQVQFVDMSEVGRNPARIIPVWRQFTDSHPDVPLRGIGEPVWRGRRPAELAEALLHESLLNLAFADAPDLLLSCPYDADGLQETVLAAVRRSHPWMVEAGTSQRSRNYRGSRQAVRQFAAPLPDADLPRDALTLQFDRIGTLRRLRALVREHAEAAGLDPRRVADLELAAHEIAVNSLRHGGRRGTLRLWSDGLALVCEIRDSGHITEPLVGRIRPQTTQLSGRGVWLAAELLATANQLCDLVQVRSSASGTVVRLHMTL
jgi:anti-sigma regulatory factor (Ser/Thr protein kinase)